MPCLYGRMRVSRATGRHRSGRSQRSSHWRSEAARRTAEARAPAI